MPRIVLELSLAVALTLAAILASVTGANASELTVTGAFARASATPTATSGAAYMTITNHGTAADRLVGITTPAAASAVLHTTQMDGDVKKMEAAGAVEILPGGTLEMKPGGSHVMMMGLSAPLKQGGTIELTLSFETAGELKVMVPVGGIAAGSP